MGMIYKRGEVFWIKYYSGGKPIRESTGTSKQKEAERFLKHREGRSAAGSRRTGTARDGGESRF